MIVPRDRKMPRAEWRLLNSAARLHRRINAAALQEIFTDQAIYGSCFYTTKDADIREFFPRAPARTVTLMVRISPSEMTPMQTREGSSESK